MIKFTDYLYDLIQNSIHANANLISLEIVYQEHMLYITISDDGMGMDKETLNQVRSFSYTSNHKRSVGLGLSMINDLCNQTNGSFKIDSTFQKGTQLFLSFDPKHIDFPDFGDLGLLISDLYMHQSIKIFDFIYQNEHKVTRYEINQSLTNHKRSFRIKQEIEQKINKNIEEVKEYL